MQLFTTFDSCNQKRYPGIQITSMLPQVKVTTFSHRTDVGKWFFLLTSELFYKSTSNVFITMLLAEVTGPFLQVYGQCFGGKLSLFGSSIGWNLRINCEVFTHKNGECGVGQSMEVGHRQQLLFCRSQAPSWGTKHKTNESQMFSRCAFCTLSTRQYSLL